MNNKHSKTRHAHVKVQVNFICYKLIRFIFDSAFNRTVINLKSLFQANHFLIIHRPIIDPLSHRERANSNVQNNLLAKW